MNKQLNLFSEEQLDEMIVRKHNYKMVKCVGKDGLIHEHPEIRKTKEQFVAQARTIWGDRYNYTDSIYTSNKEPITIYCPKHNHHFRVAMAQNHLMRHKPTGCPICRAEETHKCEYGTDWQKYLKLCAKNNRVGRIVQLPSKKYTHHVPLTPEEKAARHAKTVEQQRIRQHKAAVDNFRAKLQAKFGDKYTFNDNDYRGVDYSMVLVCKYHGEFRAAPREILTDRATGRHSHRECPVCEGRKVASPPITAAEFFERMHQIYGDKYDFSISKFENKSSNIEFKCPEHGLQSHKASSLLSGCGCDYCSGRRFYGPDFIKLARLKHGDKYDYSQVGEITNIRQEVMIGCPIHGFYPQKVELHLRGHGCPECYGSSNKWSAEERGRRFLDKAQKMFPGKFDYSRVQYVNKRTPVLIRCIEHDCWFECKPNDHVHKRSAGCCPVCTCSSGELAINRWLTEHGFTFNTDWVIPNNDPTLPLQYLTVDFQLKHQGQQYFIEFNGEQHYKNVYHFYEGKNHRTFEVQQHRDRYLRHFCTDNNIKLIEIAFSDFDRIDDILKANLLTYSV